MQKNLKIKFDIQKHKGGSTVNQTYTPTEQEIELQQIQVNYTKAIYPNMLYLNQTARSVLENSLGTVQVDYSNIMQDIYKLLYEMDAGLGENRNLEAEFTFSAHDSLETYVGEIPKVVKNHSTDINTLKDDYLKPYATTYLSEMGTYANDTEDNTDGYETDIKQYNKDYWDKYINGIGTTSQYEILHNDIKSAYTTSITKPNKTLKKLDKAYEKIVPKVETVYGGIFDEYGDARDDTNDTLKALPDDYVEITSDNKVALTSCQLLTT